MSCNVGERGVKVRAAGGVRGRAVAAICAAGLASVVSASALGLLAPRAQAGTYVINECAAAQAGDYEVGPWAQFGALTAPGSFKQTCASADAFFGIASNGIPSNATAGEELQAPASITMQNIKLWWEAPAPVSGGGWSYALVDVYSPGWSRIFQSTTPMSANGAGRTPPSELPLPTNTTKVNVEIYCTNSENCTYDESPLAIYGSQITLVDSAVPRGSVIGGGLSGAGPVSGVQSLAYEAQDSGSGVRLVELLVDGHAVAKNDYLGECPYANYAACPPGVSGTISWDTSSIADASHELAMRVISAGGNSTIVDDHEITTDNGPAVSSAPTVSGTPAVGQTLTATSAVVSSTPQAGNVKQVTQWLRCDSAGNNCSAIAGATGASYNLTSADEGHTLRYKETISNDDGSTSTESSPVGPIAPSAGEKEKAGANGANGTNGSPGTGGSGGSGTGSGSTVNVNLAGPLGASQGAVLLGSAASWVVSLKVSPLKVRRHSKIKLSGLVSTSPRPSSGKLIYLQARSVGSAIRGKGSKRHRVTVYGKWVTFQAFRAKSNGSYSSSYIFKLGGKHTYEFRAIAPAEGQYRNPTGTSTAITVKET
jgi:hypothetical protein